MGLDVTVAALMTAPRYEGVQARNQIERALNEAGVPLAISQGVYYGQCMQNMMEEVASKSIDYVLTVDFDSIFTAAHVRRLLDIIVQEDEIDALAALQPMRGIGRVLGSIAKETDVEYDGMPIKVLSAHFGLTVMDVKKLSDTPKPWFHSEPDKNGSWGDERTDDDVSFWRNWTSAGNTIFIDPGTRLGHMEEMVTVFDPEMKPAHLYFKKWQEIAETTVD